MEGLACPHLIFAHWMEQHQGQAPEKARWEHVIAALTGWLHCLSVTYGMTSSSTYYFTKAMTELFVNTAGDGVKFQSISTMADFWSVSDLVMVFIHFQHSKGSLNHFFSSYHCMSFDRESVCHGHRYVHVSVCLHFNFIQKGKSR